MYKTIKDRWLGTLISELTDTSEIRIISPFINQVMVNHLLTYKETNAQVTLITRFNLNDFVSGVSSLAALRTLVKAGALVKGIKGLHSKVYLFDQKSVVLTSANFTSGGFFNNHEFGILSSDSLIIAESHAYFQGLCLMDPGTLDITTIDGWQAQIDGIKGQRNQQEALPDHGKNTVPLLNQQRNYFIKFFGSGGDRANHDYTVKGMIEDTHCHYALTFSGRKGKPRKYQDGDIVFIARILHGQDYAIVGHAEAYRHVDSRDMATPEDIGEIEWRTEWPVYIRIHSPIFIDGTMADCPKMSQLIGQLQYDCFDKTSKRHQWDGEAEINPWESLSRQADVQLSELGAQWMDLEVEKAINTNGAIPDSFINTLYKPIVEGL